MAHSVIAASLFQQWKVTAAVDEPAVSYTHLDVYKRQCLLRLVIGITGYYQATVHNQHETCHANKKCSEHYHHLHHIKIYG